MTKALVMTASTPMPSRIPCQIPVGKSDQGAGETSVRAPVEEVLVMHKNSRELGELLDFFACPSLQHPNHV